MVRLAGGDRWQTISLSPGELDVTEDAKSPSSWNNVDLWDFGPTTMKAADCWEARRGRTRSRSCETCVGREIQALRFFHRCVAIRCCFWPRLVLNSVVLTTPFQGRLKLASATLPAQP